MGLEEQAYKYAVKNAFLHGGKADAGAVAGKLKALNPEKEMKELALAAQKAVATVNALPKAELESDYKKFEAEGYELKPKEKTEGLAELAWAEKGKVITRFAPNPNGPIHLGSSRAAILSHEYARKYEGKFILRFDDTDPKVKKPMEDAETVFREDLEWLGCKIDKLFFASDRLQIYEAYMEKLLKKGHAYVCTCRPEEWREKIKNEKACPCRDLPPTEQMERFEKMRSHKFKEGQAVLRIKTSLSHKDPSVRDWWAAKIVDRPIHPRASETQHVWPSYNFASAIDDHEMGTTLIIRGQEHAQNETKQMFLYNYFGWEYPHTFYTGRVMLEGAVLSTSKIKEGIEKGEFIGWSDPRLGTIASLRRRGFHPEAIRKIIISIGTKPNDTTITWDQLAAENREIIKDEAEKIKVLEKPFKLVVEYAPEKKIKSEFGDVVLHEGLQDFFVEKSAVEKSAGTTIRLREAYNVKIKKVSELQAIGEYAGEQKIEPIVPWISEGIEIHVILPTGKKITKIADTRIMSKNIGDRVYLDKIGYCRIDRKEEKKVVAWFTHK
ncbi:MAG: glutamate--tRNA ligase [Candidatus Diapherotrites archaeon]